MGKKKQKELVANRKYRDTVFRMLFKEKRELLSLFNAIHGTHYEEADELAVTTLENAIYMSMKNDISCVLDMRLDLYEHQSTVNPNMPLRNLFYVAKLLEVQTQNQDLYASKQITLPAPMFIVFYNGSEPQPERREYRLSDSYARKDGDICLELIVLQININPGYNETLMSDCHILLEYMMYTDRVRCYAKDMPLAEAVERAVDECIEEGILSEFLQKNRGEVIPMSIFEYDEKRHMETVRNEGIEWGIQQGLTQGIEQGLTQGKTETAKRLIQLGKISMEDIAAATELSVEQVRHLAQTMSCCINN